MPVFFIKSTDIQGSNVSLSPSLSLHLAKSLRVQSGQTILLGDDLRRRHRATVIQIGKERLIADIQETYYGPDLDNPPVILVQAVLKSDKMAWIIQKATELGISHIVPLFTERSIPRFNSTQAKNHQERWQRIALEAAQQSERWEVPMISPVQSFEVFCAGLNPKELSLILVERALSVSLNSIPLPTQWEGSLSLLVGPEGGWSEAEIAEAEKRECQRVSLGPRILRAETASIAGLAILQSRLGHMG